MFFLSLKKFIIEISLLLYYNAFVIIGGFRVFATEKEEKHHRYLNIIEDDIPDSVFNVIGPMAYSRLNEGVHMKYILGLFLLHNNKHPEALALFKEVAKEFPLAINPKLYFIIASLEASSPADSENGYYRDFFLYELSQLNSNHINSIVLALEGLNQIWDKKKLTGIENIKKAEVLGGDFYPMTLLATRGYIAVGDKNTFTNYYNALVKRYPRLGLIQNTVFSPKPF